MSNKVAFGAVVVLLILGGVYFFFGGKEEVNTNIEQANNQTPAIEGASVVTEGNYELAVDRSVVEWSVGKPLIEGYINSGTILFKEGEVSVGNATATASFIIDMNSLRVGLTAKKPGKESALEKHLKSKDFFEVEKNGTAEFKIETITARADSQTSLTYDVSGVLTMKGVSNSVTFPAQIYLKDGELHAHADLTIDRTKWGITYGSGSFFDNLADNVIDDNVKLKLVVIAKKSE